MAKLFTKNWLSNGTDRLKAQGANLPAQMVDQITLWHVDGREILFNEWVAVNKQGLPLVPVECRMLDDFLLKRAEH